MRCAVCLCFLWALRSASKIASIKGIAAASFGRSRSGIFRSGGTAFARASRTIRRCTPNFLATPFIVPAPCSYSRRICSYNSTLTLLFSKPFLPSGLESPKQDTRFLVYRGAKSEHRSGPIQSSELIRLAGDGVAVAKQELLSRVILEMIVATQVDHRRSLGLRCRVAFPSMGKDLDSQLEPLVQGPFHQPSGVGKVAVIGLRNHFIARAAVKGPVPDVLLQPERKFVPDFPNPQPFVVVSGRDFEHRKRADLGNVFRLLD